MEGEPAASGARSPKPDQGAGDSGCLKQCHYQNRPYHCIFHFVTCVC